MIKGLSTTSSVIDDDRETVSAWPSLEPTPTDNPACCLIMAARKIDAGFSGALCDRPQVHRFRGRSTVASTTPRSIGVCLAQVPPFP